MKTDSFNTLHILYADDDHDDRLLFTEAVKESKLNASLTILEDGKKLLEFVKLNPTWADFIFLDINMPYITGDQCLLQLKSDLCFRHIPVIMLSTSVFEREKLFALGAHHIISKIDFGLNPVEMLTSILKPKQGFALMRPETLKKVSVAGGRMSGQSRRDNSSF